MNPVHAVPVKSTSNVMASSPEPRPAIHVAAGVLRDLNGQVLIACRPAGKSQAGMWEFPGGKIDTGELPLAALARELREELGVEVAVARHLARYSHNYPERCVHLYVWLVTAWRGTPVGLEKQQLQWLEPARLMLQGLLPADELIADLLQAEVAVNQLATETALQRVAAA